MNAATTSAAVVSFSLAILFQNATAELPSYIPQHVAPRATATYSDHGAVTIVGYNDMNVIFEKLNTLFVRSHPGFRFNMRLRGTAAAPAALAFGVSKFAPMGAEFSVHEANAFHAITGNDPIAFRVARGSLDPRARSAPIGIFVNTANPLESLTSRQVARIFTTGQRSADITSWGQLGLTDDWRERSIRPAGIAEEAAGGLSSFMLAKMRGLPFAPMFDGFPQSTDVVKRVAQDAAAIGFASGNLSNRQVKALKIDGKGISEDSYPYDRFLLIYFNQATGDPIDEFISQYLRLILSNEGQMAIASAEPHYRPLTALELTAELAKLDGLAHARPVPRPQRSPATLASSTFRIMGPARLRMLLETANALFMKKHSGFSAVLTLQGTPAALDGLSAGVAALALCDRAAWPLELRPFRQLQGYEPLDIHIGRVGYSAPNQPTPPAVYLNAANPLSRLTLQQVKQIFVRGSSEGDVTRWAQVGLAGPWASRAIHVYGQRDDGSFASAMRHEHFDSLPFTRTHQPLLRSTDAVKAVADDPLGIALLDSIYANGLPREIRMLALARSDDAPYSAATYADVLQGKYPLSPYLHVYINRAPRHLVDVLVREYLEFLLSSQGQETIADSKEAGVVTLSAGEISRELDKLR